LALQSQLYAPLPQFAGAGIQFKNIEAQNALVGDGHVQPANWASLISHSSETLEPAGGRGRYSLYCQRFNDGENFEDKWTLLGLIVSTFPARVTPI
jgi:hypothetical protein